jgi:hypothetical protein
LVVLFPPNTWFMWALRLTYFYHAYCHSSWICPWRSDHQITRWGVRWGRVYNPRSNDVKPVDLLGSVCNPHNTNDKSSAQALAAHINDASRWFNSTQNEAIGPLNLAIGLRMCHISKAKAYPHFLTIMRKLLREVWDIIYDDAMWETKSHQEFLHKS